MFYYFYLIFKTLNRNIRSRNEHAVCLTSNGNRYRITRVDEQNIHTVCNTDIIIGAVDLQVIICVSVIYGSQNGGYLSGYLGAVRCRRGGRRKN